MQAEAVRRERELFPNMSREQFGVDDEPLAGAEEDEEATDVGAPIDAPEDLEVRGGPSGVSVLRAEAALEQDEARQAQMVEVWAQWGELELEPEPYANE